MGNCCVEVAGARLQVRTRCEPGIVTVEVIGQIESGTEPVLRHALDCALAHHPRDVIADVSGIAFCSVRALGTLLLGATEARRHGVRWAFAGMNPSMLRLWQIVYPRDLAGRAPRYATVSEATAALSRAQPIDAEERVPVAGADPEHGGVPDPDRAGWIDELYRSSGQDCFSLARFLLDDDAEAESIVGETFATAAASPVSGEWSRTRLLTAVHHQALQRLRHRQGPHRNGLADVADPAVASRRGDSDVGTGEQPTGRSQMVAALGELDRLQHRAILLAYQGSTPGDIASRIGRPRADVMAALHTAVGVLHARIHGTHPAQ